jgi:hypothetical protein
MFEHVLQMYIKIQTTVHGMHCSVQLIVINLLYFRLRRCDTTSMLTLAVECNGPDSRVVRVCFTAPERGASSPRWVNALNARCNR